MTDLVYYGYYISSASITGSMQQVDWSEIDSSNSNELTYKADYVTYGEVYNSGDNLTTMVMNLTPKINLQISGSAMTSFKRMSVVKNSPLTYTITIDNYTAEDYAANKFVGVNFYNYNNEKVSFQFMLKPVYDFIGKTYYITLSHKSDYFFTNKILKIVVNKD